MKACAPNITGQHGGHLRTIRYVIVTGAFYSVSAGSTNSESGWDSMLVQFDASRCSEVYGAEDTIRPLSVSAYFLIKY